MWFNSSQISAAHSQIGAAVRGFPLTHKKKSWHRDWKDDWKDEDAEFVFWSFASH